MTRIKVRLNEKWKEANIEIMRLGVLQSLNGITGHDEDLIDIWESRIPTQLKLLRNIMNRKGEYVSFIDEWDSIVATIKPGETDETDGATRRKRVIAKGRLITDLLQVFGVYMQVTTIKKAEEGDAFARDWPEETDESIIETN